MPIYNHECQVKGCRKKGVEVWYDMKYVGDEKSLPADILKKITCRHGIMNRVPYLVHVKGMSGGTIKTDKQLLAEKQAQKKIRSRHHFNNEVRRTITDKGEKRHFDKKFKNFSRKDHEKL